jgi:hypothetical protein
MPSNKQRRQDPYFRQLLKAATEMDRTMDMLMGSPHLRPGSELEGTIRSVGMRAAHIYAVLARAFGDAFVEQCENALAYARAHGFGPDMPSLPPHFRCPEDN